MAPRKKGKQPSDILNAPTSAPAQAAQQQLLRRGHSAAASTPDPSEEPAGPLINPLSQTQDIQCDGSESTP
ncbi:hypothetical protein E1B28_011971, partial [Marasmius oreades]